LIDLPTGARSIIRIAAGSSSIGAHSMAIDKEGRLYGWGVAYAVGVGVVKAITSPVHVNVGSGIQASATSDEGVFMATRAEGTFGPGGRNGSHEDTGDMDDVDDFEFLEELEEEEVNRESGNVTTAASGGKRHRRKFTAAQKRFVVDVACGGGFTACVTQAGHVYTWGVWAHGRLGKASQ
jgi:alpha-tubulin suppressor-like RCC1 family protein